MSRQFTFENWRSLAESRQNWSKRDEHVVKVTCMVNILCFIGNLKTRISHSKMHCVSVDKIREGFRRSRDFGCVHVLVDGGEDLDFLCPALADWLCKSKEPWVRTCGKFRNKNWFSTWISFSDALRERILYFPVHFWIWAHHTVGCAKDQSGSCWCNFYVAITILTEILLYELASKK